MGRALPRNAAGIGCRGGTSAIAGKKRSTYAFRLPSGERQETASFKVGGPTAVAWCYQWRGTWYFQLRAEGAPPPFVDEGVALFPVEAIRIPAG